MRRPTTRRRRSGGACVSTRRSNDCRVECSPPCSPGRIEGVEQRLATTKLSDGTQIAYALAGDGPFLVYAAGWLTHLELSWALPPERGFYEALARGRTLIRYDRPGCGLSGPSGRPYTMDLELETL